MTIDRIFVNTFAKTTERGAYGASIFKGKNDKIAADQAAVDEMRTELNKINTSSVATLYLSNYNTITSDISIIPYTKFPDSKILFFFFILIVFTHRQNIKNLKNKTENKIKI